MCQMPPTETETYHTANLLGVQLKVSSTDTLAQTLASLAGDQRSIRFIRCRNTESRSDFSMCGAPLFNCVSHEFYTPFFLVSSGRVRSSPKFEMRDSNCCKWYICSFQMSHTNRCKSRQTQAFQTERSTVACYSDLFESSASLLPSKLRLHTARRLISMETLRLTFRFPLPRPNPIPSQDFQL